MNIVMIPLDQIDAGRRLRAVDPDYAALIGASMVEQGQMTPIEVIAVPGEERPYRLVAGGHRYVGAGVAGMTEIAATLFEGSELQAEMREIDENLIRHELKELDRATFLARRKVVYEALNPSTKAGGKRAKGQVANFGNLTARFTAEAAEKVGLSERSISRAIQRYTRLTPEVRAKIAGLWIANNGAELDALAKLAPTEQAVVANLLATYPSFRRVSEARDHAGGRDAPPPPNPLDAQFDAFLRLWRRMPALVRTRVRTHVNSKAEKP